jgi:hypothetical protein
MDTEALGALLSTLIPPDAARGLPGAGEVDFVAYMRDQNIESFVRDGLAQLDKDSVAKFQAPFGRLNPAQQADAVGITEKTNALFFRSFMKHVVQCYYQDDRVLRGIGTEARPPFPDGFHVDEGDLTLLEPVVERPPLYRS